MATIDQQFVEYIVKTLVNNPDKVVVDREIDERGVLLSLSVDPEDVGRVIGKRGATAHIPQHAKINNKKNRLGGRFKLTKYTTDILSGLFGSPALFVRSTLELAQC